MAHYVYSTHPSREYRLSASRCCAWSAIQEFDEAHSMWNLLWLSVPSVDSLHGSPSDWIEANFPVSQALVPVIQDIQAQPVLTSRLLMHPDKFLSWFSALNPAQHERFHLHRRIGNHWPELVMERAEAAARRHMQDAPRISFGGGTVLQVDFSRKAGG